MGVDMYTAFLAIQYLGIGVLVAEILYILNKPNTKLQIILLFTSLATVLDFVGYLMEITASSEETAIAGLEVSYLGKPFIYLGFFMFVMYYCRVSIPKIMADLLIGVHLGFTVSVFAYREWPFFYKSIHFVDDGGFPHLICEPGPLFYMQISLFAIGATVCVYCSVREWVRAKTSIEKRQAVFILLMIVSLAVGLAVYLSGYTKGYDTTQIAYLVNNALLAVSIFSYRLFEVLTLAKEKALNDYQDGLIVIDNRNMVIYANYLAKEIFPTLSHDNYQDVIDRLNMLANTQVHLFYQQKVFVVKKDAILQEAIAYGKTYKIIDVTDSYYYATRLKSDVEEKTRQLKEIQSSVIESFANMIEARDGITGHHIKHTSAYVRILIYGLKSAGCFSDILTDEYIATVIDVAPLHDVGKIGILDQVLKKNEKLTDEEFDTIKTHPRAGAEIIESILKGVESDSYITIAKDVALYHHEKWDGTGYPYGLRNNKIPLCARIMAVADVYDALRSKRSYKDGFTKEKSKEIIMQGAGSHFDPVIVQVFMDNIDKIEAVE